MPHPHIPCREQADRSLAQFYERLGYSPSQRRDSATTPLVAPLTIVQTTVAPSHTRPPQSIREHVAKSCQPGRAIVLAPSSSMDHLDAAIRRWRQDEDRRSAGTEIIIHSKRLTGVRDRFDADLAGITLSRICSYTALAIAVWLGSGFAGAIAMGRL